MLKIFTVNSFKSSYFLASTDKIVDSKSQVILTGVNDFTLQFKISSAPCAISKLS